MDETGVLGLIEELSILLEDSKPVFGKSNMRQVDIAEAFNILDDMSALRKCREEVKKSLSDVRPKSKTTGDDYGKLAKEVLSEVTNA